MKRFNEYFKAFEIFSIFESISADEAIKILGLENGKSYSAKEIKKIYYNLARKYHPDLGGSLDMMKKLNSAYEMFKSGVNNGGTDSKNFEWNDDKEYYRNLCKMINDNLKKTFDSSKYVKYLNSVIPNANFKETNRKYVGEEKTFKVANKLYGAPTYAGLEVKFEDTKNDLAITVKFHIYLPNVKYSKSLSTDGATVPLDIDAKGYIAGREFKLYRSEWKRTKISDSKINDVEKILPESKIKKQLSKKTRTKMTKKDYIAYIEHVLNGKDISGDYTYYIPTKDKNMYIVIKRGTMMRTPYYQIGISEKVNSWYKYKGEIVSGASFILEKPDIIDLFSQLKNVSVRKAKSVVEDFIKNREAE
jgi:curved DNA-binding protein CbpA